MRDGSVIGPLLFLIVVNGHPDALEAQPKLFENGVKMVTQRPQNVDLHSSLIVA